MNQSRSTRLVAMLLAFCLMALWAAPADAGRGKRKKRNKKKTTVEQPATVEESAPVIQDDVEPEPAPDPDLEAAIALAEYVGTLDPTNVPILTGDMFSIVEDTEVDRLLDTDVAHKRATGKGVTVAVLDGGFTRPNDDIMNRVQDPFDVVERDNDPIDNGNGFDDDGDGVVDGALGHGTFVAGMVLDVAPDARIVPIRVADDEGRTTDAWIREGIEYAKQRQVDVINMSLEMTTLSDATAKALHSAAMQGIIIVVSAGNRGSDGALGALADSGMTIAVGAVDCDGTLAPFSNFESTQSWWNFDSLVYAPGVDLQGPCGFPHKDSMCIWSGTSFATGLVAGAVALELEQIGSDFTFFVPLSIRAAIDPVYTVDGQKLERAGQINLLKLLGLESAYSSYEADKNEEAEPESSEPESAEPESTDNWMSWFSR